MIRATALAFLLSGCTAVQVLPIVNPTTDDVSCCVVYAEIPPSTRASISVTKSDAGAKVKLGTKFRF